MASRLVVSKLPAMLVLVAPDCYGDSLSATEAAAAIATGWTRSRPGDRFMIAPQSDGGPGFVEVLAGQLGETRRLRVSGPLDTPVEAAWVFDAATKTAYLECAQACGLALLDGPPTPETALAASSRGVGQLIAEALRAGARRIVVGLGRQCVHRRRAGNDCRARRPGSRPRTTGRSRADRRLGRRISAAGTVGCGQGFRAPEGCRHGDRGRARSPAGGVGARTGRGGREGTSAANRARAPPEASAPGCSLWAPDASPVRRSSPNTPIWPRILPSRS